MKISQAYKRRNPGSCSLSRFLIRVSVAARPRDNRASLRRFCSPVKNQTPARRAALQHVFGATLHPGMAGGLISAGAILNPGALGGRLVNRCPRKTRAYVQRALRESPSRIGLLPFAGQTNESNRRYAGNNWCLAPTGFPMKTGDVEIWTDADGTKYRLVNPEIVSYPQKPVKINGKMVEQPNAEFTIVTAEKVE